MCWTLCLCTSVCVSVTCVARAVSILASDTLQPLRWVCNIAAQNTKRGQKARRYWKPRNRSDCRTRATRLGGTESAAKSWAPAAQKSADKSSRAPYCRCKGNEEWTRQAMIMNGFKWWDMFGIGPQKASHLHIIIALSILCVADADLFMTWRFAYWCFKSYQQHIHPPHSLFQCNLYPWSPIHTLVAHIKPKRHIDRSC